MRNATLLLGIYNPNLMYSENAILEEISGIKKQPFFDHFQASALIE